MKPALLLRQAQRLTMTPQLRQALALLQMSAVELNQTLQEALEQNLLLERADEANDTAAQVTAERGDSAPTDAAPESAEDEVLAEWDSAEVGLDWQSSAEEPPEPLPPDGTTLQAHLLWQLELSRPSARDAAIGAVLIDSLNDDGYLREDLGSLCEALTDSDAAPEVDEIEAVLHRIQSFDPPGVGARDLRECLQIQLRQMDQSTLAHALAQTLVSQHLDALAAHGHERLCRLLDVTATELDAALVLVQSLNPRPGTTLGSGTVDYIHPDVVVQRRDGHWRVELNPNTAPRIRINAAYASALGRRQRDASPDLNRQLQEARWLVRSLRMRNETLLRVAESMVRHQSAFLDDGEEAMRPLLLKDVAAELALHESTISRVVANKYISTPRGNFAFRHFFSNELSTDNGSALSSTAIRAMIRKLVAQEDPHQPLSDDRITRELVNRGVRVARRTVAKYREAMTIPPAYERKRLETR
ncbi:MAG TPA: RNA polymerase factor sigma-54 [Gammaproteobacteria bacterium]|nr:RNA polymerase factor sigma-54 [Gammaproteobacteria bacterium]